MSNSIGKSQRDCTPHSGTSPRKEIMFINKTDNAEFRELTADELDMVAGGWDTSAAMNGAWSGAIATGIAGGISGAVLGPAASFGFGVGFIAGGIGGFIAGGLSADPKVCVMQQ
jgi:hypothetical protein